MAINGKKTEPTKRKARPRAKGFTLPSDVHAVVREVDGFIEIDVEIQSQRLNTLAFAGMIPAIHLCDLRSCSQDLIADLVDFERLMSVQRTHRQLVRDLSELRRIASSGVVPAVTPSLRQEIISLALRVQLGFSYRSPRKISFGEVADYIRAGADARAEAARALLDAPALARLLDQVIDFVVRSGATTPQFYASKGAFRLEDEVIHEWIEDFWQRVLGRRLVTTELLDFAIAVFKMCGVPVPPSLERRLENRIRNAHKDI